MVLTPEFMLEVLDPCVEPLCKAYVERGAPADQICFVTLSETGMVEGSIVKMNLLDDLLIAPEITDSLKALIDLIKTEKRDGYVWFLFSSALHGAGAVRFSYLDASAEDTNPNPKDMN